MGTLLVLNESHALKDIFQATHVTFNYHKEEIISEESMEIKQGINIIYC